MTRGRVHVTGGRELAEGWQARQHSAGGFRDEVPKLLKGESVIAASLAFKDAVAS